METEMETGTKINPKRFDISLVFFRDNNKYPQKGSIVRWDHGDFCDHIEEIEKNRAEADILKNGDTFCLITQSYQKMLYNNDFNRRYPHLPNDIPLIVEEVFFEGKNVMARCSANGYNYPIDSLNEMKLILPADDLSVVDIILCDYVAVFSDSKPDNTEFMGFFDVDTSKDMGSKIFQKFRVRENYQYADILREQVIKNGIKEFSYLYPVNPVTKKPVLLDGAEAFATINTTSTKKLDHDQHLMDEIEGSIESLSMDHPLSNYTKRMFASVIENLNRENLGDEDINDIYFDMLSVMKNTFIHKDSIVMTEPDLDISDSVDRDY